ncbi:hypothetical protein D9758_012542 [Tetrapyrgos nigripes]|uniref:Uncharacterized protein n=1 Tax=Tetrapyrgos nigripes TaxID=182062 RepID=A0A8H5G399_9AGAR|nr:hypothetical protein D9758_012542 [Tetrapyrgos nigripes]
MLLGGRLRSSYIRHVRDNATGGDDYLAVIKLWCHGFRYRVVDVEAALWDSNVDVEECSVFPILHSLVTTTPGGLEIFFFDFLLLPVDPKTPFEELEGFFLGGYWRGALCCCKFGGIATSDPAKVKLVPRGIPDRGVLL